VEGYLQFYALVATHHKTGSVWMRTVFKSIARETGLPFVNLSKGGTFDSRRQPPAIVFSDHSDFSLCAWLLDDPRTRILHVIRDPRDVIISAMHYHRQAKEVWLHEPRKALRGLTYQQKLNRLPDNRARYLFEMDRSAMRVIRDMEKWDSARPSSLECKYEDLIADEQMELASRILVHLGFEAELETCRQVFWKNSLFGELKGSQSTHIRSGAMRQWPEIFDGRLAAAFIKKFPDALVRLGYERDNSWVDALHCCADMVDHAKDLDRRLRRDVEDSSDPFDHAAE
jgi:hypothetical protein